MKKHLMILALAAFLPIASHAQAPSDPPAVEEAAPAPPTPKSAVPALTLAERATLDDLNAQIIQVNIQMQPLVAKKQVFVNNLVKEHPGYTWKQVSFGDFENEALIPMPRPAAPANLTTKPKGLVAPPK